jgi:rfaE bifunctional protein nucleotidyltransferase chain/domain
MVVLGDAVLDRTWEGTADRLCPDAVGPVVDLQRETSTPGGAALTALAAAALGARVVFVTALGDDAAGDVIRRQLTGAGVTVIDLSLHGPTPEKIRVRCAAGTVTRVDRGCAPVARIGALGTHGPIRRRVEEALGAAHAVLLSDYGRRLVTDVVGELRATDRTAGRLPLTGTTDSPPTVPVVWDPHPASARPDTALTLATPNLREAAAAAGSGGPVGPVGPMATGGGAAEFARLLAATWRCAVAVTCGAAGAAVATPGEIREAGSLHHVPAVAVEGDTCGAGDWFAAGASHALALGATPVEAATAGCDAAAAWVGSGPRRLARLVTDIGAGPDPLRRVVATSGCFDVLHVGHLSMLRHARSLGDRLVVLVNSDESVRRLKGQGRPVNTEDDRVTLLRGLECVDEVRIFDELTPCRVLTDLRPDVFVKGADYADRALPEAEVVARWGGQVVFAPLVSGRSTTRVLRVAGELAGRRVG